MVKRIFVIDNDVFSSIFIEQILRVKMDNDDKLQSLINISTQLSLQMEEFLISKEIENETKDLIATNMVLIDAMTKTAISFKGDEEKKAEFLQVYSETLEQNYNFIKKVLEY